MAKGSVSLFVKRVDSIAADFAFANLADPACGLHLYRETAAFCAFPVFHQKSFVQKSFVQILSNLVGILLSKFRKEFAFLSLPIEMQLVQRAVRSVSLSLGCILRACLSFTGTFKKLPKIPIEQQEKNPHERIQSTC